MIFKNIFVYAFIVCSLNSFSFGHAFNKVKASIKHASKSVASFSSNLAKKAYSSSSNLLKKFKDLPNKLRQIKEKLSNLKNIFNLRERIEYIKRKQNELKLEIEKMNQIFKDLENYSQIMAQLIKKNAMFSKMLKESQNGIKKEEIGDQLIEFHIRLQQIQNNTDTYKYEEVNKEITNLAKSQQQIQQSHSELNQNISNIDQNLDQKEKKVEELETQVTSLEVVATEGDEPLLDDQQLDNELDQQLQSKQQLENLLNVQIDKSIKEIQENKEKSIKKINYLQDIGLDILEDENQKKTQILNIMNDIRQFQSENNEQESFKGNLQNAAQFYMEEEQLIIYQGQFKFYNMSNKLDKKKMYMYKEAFNVFDIRQSGQINYEDLASVLAILHISPSRQDLDKLQMKYGVQDGKIKFKDFLQIVWELRFKEDNENVLQEAFENINDETSTHIPVSKLKEILMSKGEPFSNEEMDLFLNEADPGKTGKVIYKDFIKLLMQ